jgi:hypothetical protein
MSPDTRIFQGIDSGLTATKWSVQIRHFVNQQVGRLLREENCSESDGQMFLSFLCPVAKTKNSNGFHGMAFLVGVPEREPPIKTSEMT